MSFFGFVVGLFGMAVQIFVLVIVWRAMIAHEQIAESLARIAQDGGEGK